MVAVLNNPLVRFSRVAALLGVTLMAGCASTGGGSMRVAHDAERLQNYDVAVAEYNKILKANPNNLDAREGFDRARQRAAQDHFTRARRTTRTTASNTSMSAATARMPLRAQVSITLSC